MTGYIINLFKYATLPNGETLPTKKDDKEVGTILAFGDYDRINIAHVNDFSRYRDVNATTRGWKGPRLAILLYQIRDQEPYGGLDLLHCLSPQENGTSKEEVEKYLRGRFFALTMVTLSPEFKKYTPYREVLVQARRLIIKQIKYAVEHCAEKLEIGQDIQAEVYGSFLSSELAIVWSARQYVDILRIANTLRYLEVEVPVDGGDRTPNKFKPFISLCSVIADADSGHIHTKLRRAKAIKGKAALSIMYRDAAIIKGKAKENVWHSAQIRKVLNKSAKGFERIGEYDYVVIDAAKALCEPGENPFHAGKPLVWSGDLHKEHILSSKLVLMDDFAPKPDCGPDDCVHKNNPITGLKEIRGAEYGNAKLKNIISEIEPIIFGTERRGVACPELTWEGFKDQYEKFGLRRVIKKTFPETVGLCDSLDLLYTDFIHNCTNLNYNAWKAQLRAQFIGVLEIIADTIRLHLAPEEYRESVVESYARIADSIHAFNQVIYHVAQSRRTIFTIPSSHLRYMGHYDVILHAYYGLINFYLNLAYQLPSTDIQSELIPFLSIDVVPEIEVRCQSISAEITKRQVPKVLFTVNMPLPAMTDFLRYAMVLAHETFHTITPFDRDRRNQIIGLLYFSDFAASTLLLNFEENINKEQNQWLIEECGEENIAWLKKRLQIAISSQFCVYLKDPFYQDIHLKIGKPKSDKDSIFFCRSDYLSELQNRLTRAAVDDSLLPIRDLINEQALNNKDRLNEQIEGEIHRFITLLEYNNGHKNARSDSIIKTLKEATCVRYGRGYNRRHNYKLKDEIFCISSCLTRGFQEAAQDLSMIRIFGLDCLDYLIFRSRHKNDLLDLTRGITTSDDSCRIGMICDYLISYDSWINENSLPTPNFVIDTVGALEDEYKAFIMHLPEMVARVSGQPAPEASERARRGFLTIFDQVNEYFTDYLPFRMVMFQELFCLDIGPKIAQDHQISEEVQTSRSQLTQYYRDWKNIILSSDLKTSQKSERVFDINIDLIHMFQYWSEINNKMVLQARNQRMEDTNQRLEG